MGWVVTHLMSALQARTGSSGRESVIGLQTACPHISSSLAFFVSMSLGVELKTSCSTPPQKKNTYLFKKVLKVAFTYHD